MSLKLLVRDSIFIKNLALTKKSLRRPGLYVNGNHILYTILQVYQIF
jgi:hypothetical protein